MTKQEFLAQCKYGTVRDMANEAAEEFFQTWQKCGDALYTDLYGLWEYLIIPSHLCSSDDIQADVIVPGNDINGGHHVALNWLEYSTVTYSRDGFRTRIDVAGEEIQHWSDLLTSHGQPFTITEVKKAPAGSASDMYDTVMK